MNVLERNELALGFQNMIWWTIHNNRRLITALRLEDADVYQELMIVLLRSLNTFDPARGALPKYLLRQLQYGMLDLKRQHKPHGMTSIGKNAVEFKSFDYSGDSGFSMEIPVVADWSRAELWEGIQNLTSNELAAVRLRIKGDYPRKMSDKKSLAEAQRKLSLFFAQRGDTVGHSISIA